ncbi:MAG TPA: hypothetical protein VG126_18910 [Thermoleophilaceae bacterium]|nr:hypothetical protein [Thermoleophilaceae bacterium]
MQYALPRPTQTITIPLVTLLLGAAGGATVSAIVADDEVIRLPALSQPADPQVSSSFSERPQEGAPAQATRSSAPSVLSERTTDRPVPTTSQFNSGPQEGAAVQAMGR